jgi:hypothetical protein
MITTVWALEQGKFDDSDISWCRGLGVEVRVEPLYYNSYINGKLVNQEVDGLKIRLTTTCERQETMLKLKYGVSLIEVQRISTLPGHDLHEIDF